MTMIAPTVRQTISRAQAASMLRAARQALATCDERSGEIIGWTLTALRDNYHARRIKIDYLMRTGHWDSADALMVRTIMHLRDHPLLRLRLARSFLEQGRIEQAAKEIRHVLKARPEHGGALVVAARIAAVQGDHKKAAALWMQASDRKPHDEAIRVAFVQSLLDAKLTAHAVAECQRLSNPPALLSARICRAQGRTLDAIEHLEAAIARHVADADVLCELIGLCEATGDITRFRRLALLHIANAPNAVRLRAAEACLSFGEFDQAIVLAERIAEEPIWRDRAQQVKHIALLMRGDEIAQPANFDDATRDRSRRSHSDDRRRLAALWANSMLGRLIVRQSDSRAAGADPFASVLQPMMRQALSAIEAVASNEQEELEHREEAMTHRRTLAAALSSAMVQTRSHVLDHIDHQSTPDAHESTPMPLRRAA